MINNKLNHSLTLSSRFARLPGAGSATAVAPRSAARNRRVPVQESGRGAPRPRFFLGLLAVLGVCLLVAGDARGQIVQNGTFSDNYTSFRGYPGYANNNGNPSILDWSLVSGNYSSAGVNGEWVSFSSGGNGYPFSPATPPRLQLSFHPERGQQGGPRLCRGLAPSTTYQLSYSAAGRSGNTGTAWRVVVYSDSSYSTSWYDSGTVAGNTAAFQITGRTLSPRPVRSPAPRISCCGIAAAMMDQTVDFGNVTIVPTLYYLADQDLRWNHYVCQPND